MYSSIEQSSKQLKKFFYSQYFGDGFKITLGLVLPSFICYQFNFIEMGVALSLGALSVSIADNPGPTNHRRNAMIITAVLSFLMALTTGILTPYTWLLASFIAVSCFLFSMLNVFGARAASVGISALIIMILGIDTDLPWHKILNYSLYILAGGAWYFTLSMAIQTLRPYRAAEQILGECVIEIAEFIRIKAAFYSEKTDIQQNYKKMLEKQVIVNQYQESVRDILFRTRKILRDTTPIGKKLLLTFIDLIDLYDDIMIRQYKYDDIQNQFNKYNILPYFNQLINELADELHHIGEGLHNQEEVRPLYNFLPQLTNLKQKIDVIENEGINLLTLKRVLINLRNINNRIQKMYEYQFKQLDMPDYRNKELVKFVDHKLIDWKLFKANLSRSSSHFRHAARVGIVCFMAFIFTRTVSEGPHSYWILLTIIVILKPGFSLTKQRNIERIIGTIIGGLIGILVLTLFPTITARFGFLVVFMLLAYSFIRIKYVVSVLFMTPYILIIFSLTTNYSETLVAWERIIDTLIGAAAATAGSYFIFPNWESYQLKSSLIKMLGANVAYLQRIVERSSTNQQSQSNYRLARKEIYVSTAQLTTTFQRMLSEPKSKQTQANTLYRFVVVNHQLTAYLATLSNQLQLNENLSNEQVKQLRSVYHILKETCERVSEIKDPTELTRSITTSEQNELGNDFFTELYQYATDIRKIASEFTFNKE